MSPIEQMIKLDYVSVISGVFIIMFGLVAIFDIVTRLLSYLGKPILWFKKNNDDHVILQNTVLKVEELQNEHRESVKQSIAHDNKIKECVKNLSGQVESLSSMIEGMKREQDADKLAEYKDKIGQSYRLYVDRKYSDENPIPYWNHMEKEALEDLIKAYESHGGKNSFVHSVVEKEIGTWKVVSNDFRG